MGITFYEVYSHPLDMIRRMLGIVFLGFILAVPVAAAQPAGANDFNTGQDITRPLARFDARYPYQLLAKKRSKDIFTLRTDRPIVLNDH